MSKSAKLNVRIDPETKMQAEELFHNFGLTVSDAINIFLHQSIMYGGIPFEIRMPELGAPNEETKKVLNDVKNHKNVGCPFDSMESRMEALNN